MTADTSFIASGKRFMEAGSRNAQFIGVIFVGIGTVAGSAWYLGGKYVALSTTLHNIQAVNDAKMAQLHAEIGRARAEAIQEANEKFLLYGYAEEYQSLHHRKHQR